MRRDYEIETSWIAFPLHPYIPEEGLTLEELFKGRSIDIDEVKARLKRVADEEGLPLSDREMTYNSRLAQELGKWAESKGKGEEFHNAAFRAYFVDGKNIRQVPVLVELSKSLNLPGEEAQRVIEKREFKEAVDFDWSRARDMGITAVPTFVMNEKMVIGAQPYEVLEKFLTVNDVKKRAIAS